MQICCLTSLYSSVFAVFASLPVQRTLHDTGEGFEKHYRQLESGRYYVKLDDDIVYIQQGAVEAMLHEKLRNRFWIVSANIINHSGKSPATLNCIA